MADGQGKGQDGVAAYAAEAPQSCAHRHLLRPGMDRRRAFFVLLPKLWLLLVGGLLGALIGIGIYLAWSNLTDPGPLFRREEKLYIDFAFNEKTKENYDYYNAYTWNDILHTEEILGRAYARLEKEGTGITREELWEMVNIELPSDIRLIHLETIGSSEKLTDIVSEITEQELIAFADRMEEFRGMRVIEKGETKPFLRVLQTGRAAEAGAVLGFLFALIALGLWYSLDDRILLPGDLLRLTALPVSFSLKGEEKMPADILEAGMLKDISPQETPEKETVTRETPERETAPRETPERETVSCEAPERETAPRETPEKETVPREGMEKAAVSPEAMGKEAASQKVMEEEIRASGELCAGRTGKLLTLPAGISVTQAQLLFEEAQPQEIMLTGVDPRLFARCCGVQKYRSCK